MVANATPAKVTLRWPLEVNKAATSGPEMDEISDKTNHRYMMMKDMQRMFYATEA